MEFAGPTLKRKKDLEPFVVCLECDAQRHFLPTHLRLKHQLTVEAYRNRNGLSLDEPLYSQVFSDHASEARQDSPNIERGRELGNRRNLYVELALQTLADCGYMAPKLASEYSGIPQTTLQSAMQASRLPHTLASLLVRSDLGISNGVMVKLVEISDLEAFAKNHSPKNR